jgi:peptide/nickel transport system ATP-binding protein
MPRPLVEVENLRRYFDVSPPFLSRLLEGSGRQIVRAVDGVSFSIRRGETFALVGESGCGKTTVARLIVGLMPPNDGRIRFDGIEIAGLRRRRDRAPIQARMQMIFQDPYASLNPRWRVGDIVAEPLRARGLASGRKAIGERVAELLAQVRLSPADGAKYPHEFSGGQRQRISIARALAGQPEFLVCDEPTSALDVSVQAQVLNLMQDLQRQFGLTYLFISHNLAVVHHVSSQVGVMYLGRLVEWGDKRSLFDDPQHPYTRMLLDTIPDLSMRGRIRAPLAGEVPSPIDPPKGCAFHPRCPFAAPRCQAERPELLPGPSGHVACHAIEERRLPEWPGAGTGIRQHG